MVKKVNFALNAKFQVAKNRDLARIKVSDELPALDISKGSHSTKGSDPSIEDVLYMIGG